MTWVVAFLVSLACAVHAGEEQGQCRTSAHPDEDGVKASPTAEAPDVGTGEREGAAAAAEAAAEHKKAKERQRKEQQRQRKIANARAALEGALADLEVHSSRCEEGVE
jgi:hypothetical protein